MIEKLIDFFLSLIDQIIPISIINQTDKGVRLRFGQFKEVLQPRWHYKIPFVDEVVKHTVLWTTLSTPAQSLTTSDGKDVVLKMVIKYRISDIETFLLEVWDAVDAISDMTQGIAFDMIKNKTWEEVQHDDAKKEITRKARVEAKRWGIEIDTVTLSDLAKIRSIRLLNDAGSLM